MRKLILAVLAVVFLPAFVLSQGTTDKFTELQNYCKNHQSVMEAVLSDGQYGNVQISKTGNQVAGQVTITTPNLLSLPYPDYTQEYPIFTYTIERQSSSLVGGTTAYSPYIYLGTINDFQIIVIQIYHNGDIYGTHQMYVIDSKEKKYYEIPLPKGYIQKVTPYENGILVDQTAGGYQSTSYDQYYSLVTITNGILNTDISQQRVQTKFLKTKKVEK